MNAATIMETKNTCFPYRYENSRSLYAESRMVIASFGALLVGVHTHELNTLASVPTKEDGR